MKSTALLVLAVIASTAFSHADVWRVRQNRHWGAPSGGYANMPDYIEPAAAAANAAFGGDSTNDTWNSWDVDTRYGSMGGYNFIQNVRVGGLGPDDTVAQETLYSGDGLTGATVQIRSLNNNGQHSPWYNLPTSGSGFEQLTGDSHSAGTNGDSQSNTYSMQVSGLPQGGLLFYSYAHRNGDNRNDIPAGYYLTLNGGSEYFVPRSGYSEGDAASGVLIPTTVGADGLLTIVYTKYAGFTGPAFQFATIPLTVPSVTLSIDGDGTMPEASGTRTVTATLSATHTQSVTVNLAFSGTASNPADYTRSADSITIPVGQTTGTVTLTAVQDTEYENPNESIIVDIQSVDNGYEDGNQQVTATVTDDEPVPPSVTLSINGDGTVPEASGTRTVTATLSSTYVQAVTVNLAFSGTAPNPTDYTRSADAISIPLGQTTGSITLTAVQDAEYESPNETILVDIQSVDNGFEDGIQQVTATIIDDEPVPPHVELVWRVRQNRHWGAPSGGYANMPDYIEPAAAAANAVFDGNAVNDTWNSWDVDTRYGSMGGYNFINNVRVGGLGPDDSVAQETLYSGDGAHTVQIRSLSNNDQHSPWYGLPTSGSGFEQLLGGEHSAGINGDSQSNTYSVQISGLPQGGLLFYSYAHRLTSDFGRTDVPAGYYLTLNGGSEYFVPRTNALAEGDAASGVLIPTTIGTDGLLTIVYTQYAGFTGPAFQFASVASIPSYTLTYTAGAGGSISGSTPQSVLSGGSGTTVTAVADAGYTFSGWSDSIATDSRTDTNVTANISVTANFTLSATPYQLWAQGYGLTGPNAAPTADPDGDGMDNRAEFAFKGNPNDSNNGGLFYYELKDNGDVDSLNELTFTIAVRRSSVAFAADGNNAQTSAAAIDGVVYTIESDADLLGTWNSPVSYIGKSDSPPSGSGLESLSGEDWEYRTFSAFNGLDAGSARGFIRGRASGLE